MKIHVAIIELLMAGRNPLPPDTVNLGAAARRVLKGGGELYLSPVSTDDKHYWIITNAPLRDRNGSRPHFEKTAESILAENIDKVTDACAEVERIHVFEVDDVRGTPWEEGISEEEFERRMQILAKSPGAQALSEIINRLSQEK